MSDRASSYNPYASSSSRRASPAWSQPEAKSGPRPGTDFKGLSVRPGSPREAGCSSALQSSSRAAQVDQQEAPATPLHEREAEALTGLGGGKRKAQEQLTPQDDSKKARAVKSELSVVRERPLDSVEGCSAVLGDALDRFRKCGEPEVLQETCFDIATRLGGPAIDPVARDRLFRVLIEWIACYYYNEPISFEFMRGVMSACLPPGATKAQVYAWLDDLRGWMNTPDRPEERKTLWKSRGTCSQMLAAAAAAGGLTADEVAACAMRQLNDKSMPDAEFFYVQQFAASVAGALGNRGDAFEDYWPCVLRVWAAQERPRFGEVMPDDLDTIDPRATALTRDWALNQIRIASASAQWMPGLLLNLEQGDQRRFPRPQLCESLLARLVSDPTRAPQLPAVLLGILHRCAFDQDTRAWREVLRAFVQAAAPHATPAQWVAIGMGNQWFPNTGARVVHDGFLPRAPDGAVVHGWAATDGAAVQRWLALGKLCGTEYFQSGRPAERLIGCEELEETEKVRLLCRILDQVDLTQEAATHWLGRAITLPFAFDRRMDLMAHLLQSQPEVMDAWHFELARREIVSQVMAQGADDEDALQRLKDRKGSEASIESEEALALTRQIGPAQSIEALHRAWQKGQGLESLLRQSQPRVAQVDPKREALLTYRQILQSDIRQLAYTRLPAKVFDSVLAHVLRPTLAQVDRLLALPPDGKAAPRGLDDEAEDVREPQAGAPRPSSSTSSASSLSSSSSSASS